MRAGETPSRYKNDVGAASTSLTNNTRRTTTR